MKTLIAIIFLSLTCYSQAQTKDHNWYFGGVFGNQGNWQFGPLPGEFSAGLNFNNNPATTLMNSAKIYSECTVAMSNTNGDLLFYSDGDTVWNRNHQIMPNGINCEGHWSSKKSALIVPNPNNIDQFYLFGNDGHPTATGAGLFYSLIDMTLDNCLGDVIPGAKAIPLVTNTSELLSGCDHANGTDYWAITVDFPDQTNMPPSIYAYHVSAAGVAAPVITNLGQAPFNLTIDHDPMILDMAPNDLLGVASFMNFADQKKILFDFDNATGIFSLKQFYDAGAPAHAITFSENSEILYETYTLQNFDTPLYQYDLTVPNIDASRIVIGMFNGSQNDMRRGPNGQIYISTMGTTDLSFVTNGNTVGVGADFQELAFNLNGRRTSGLPNIFLQPRLSNVQSNVLDWTYQDTCVGGITSFTFPPYEIYDSIKWDFGDGSTLMNDLNPTHTYNAVGAYTVTLSFYKGCETAVDVIKTINIINGIVVDLGPDITTCDPISILDAGIIGANYLWSDNSTDQTLTVNASGTYWVNVDNGCSSSDTVVVVIGQVNAGNDNVSTVCINLNTIDLNTLLDNGVNGGNWTETSAIISNQFNPLNGTLDLAGLTAGQLFMFDYIIVGNGLCENDTSAITININNSSNAGADDAVDLCNNSTPYTISDLIGNGVNMNGTWTSQSIVNSFDPVTSILNTDQMNGGVYLFDYVVSENGCPNDTATFTFNLLEQPNAGTGQLVDLCTIDTILNLNNLLSNDADLLGTWSTNTLAGNVFNGNAGTVTLSSTLPPGMYDATYTVDQNAPCTSDQAIFTFNILDLPVGDISVSGGMGCIPIQTELNVINVNNGNYNYNWNVEGIGTYLGMQHSLTIDQEGCHDIELVITNSGCSTTISMMDAICASVYPISNFQITEVSPFVPNAEFLFTNTSQDATNYDWDFGDGNTSNETSPNHVYNTEEENDYSIELIAFNDLVCSDTSIQTIKTKEKLIYYVPNSFTPDGDNYNNTFLPVMTSGINLSDYQLTIYNRWGEIIFTSTESTIGWNGMFNGVNVAIGTYTWKLEFKDKYSDKRYADYGHVNLIR